MQDIKFVQDNYSNFDLVIENKDLAKVDGFETALNYQIFVDKRATKNDVYNPRFRGGWIGDIITKQNGYESGSFCYLKNQMRDTQVDRNELLAYIKDALLYFQNNNYVDEIQSDLNGNDITAIIKVNNSEVVKYNKLWRDTNAYN